MAKPFNVNTNRFEPYSTSRFRIFLDKSTEPIAGVSKVTGLKRTSTAIEYIEGGNLKVRRGLGRTKYDPITLERGITHDNTLEAWADAAQVLDSGEPKATLKDLRKTIRIELLNERMQIAHRWIVYRAWVSEFQAVTDLDASTNVIAIERIKLEHEGWEHDLSVPEPDESASA